MAVLPIVEDDRKTNEAVCEYLRTAGHDAIPVFDGAVTEQMARMEKDAACKITSRDEIGLLVENEAAEEVDLSKLLSSLCQPYMLIARVKGISFRIGLYIADTLLKRMNISYSFYPMEEPRGMRFVIHM